MQLTNPNDLITNIEKLQESLNHKNTPIGKKTDDKINQLLDILNSGETYTPDKLTIIGEQANPLMETLFFETHSSKELRELYQQVVISFTYWVALNGGTLTKIEQAVNALAYLANTVHDKPGLESLYEIATYLIAASDEKIKQGSNPPGSSWHVLIMNISIIATRSHNPDLMNSAFASLIQYFPNAAPSFFKEGMSEMVRLNYPEHVRIVMKRYHDLHA